MLHALHAVQLTRASGESCSSTYYAAFKFAKLHFAGWAAGAVGREAAVTQVNMQDIKPCRTV